MDIAYIGSGNRVNACYKLFETKGGFTPTGFYSNPMSGCHEIATKYNSTIFMSIDDLCAKSEVIVIATDDSILPAVIQKLGRLHITNKIIISISNSVFAHDLETGYDNTYIVLNSSAPFETMTDNELQEAALVCEGYGDKYEMFYDILEYGNVNISRMTPAQLRLYRAGIHLLQNGILATILAANKICNSAAEKRQNLTVAVKHAIKNAVHGAAAISEPYKTGKPGQVKELIDTFENNGIDSITQLYGAVAKIITESSTIENDVADDIYRAIRKINY